MKLTAVTQYKISFVTNKILNSFNTDRATQTHTHTHIHIHTLAQNKVNFHHWKSFSENIWEIENKNRYTINIKLENYIPLILY